MVPVLDGEVVEYILVNVALEVGRAAVCPRPVRASRSIFDVRRAAIGILVVRCCSVSWLVKDGELAMPLRVRVDCSPGVHIFDFVHHPRRDGEVALRTRLRPGALSEVGFYPGIVCRRPTAEKGKFCGNDVLHIAAEEADLVADVLVEPDDVLAEVVQLV